ncbi:MAG: hypothetical protein WCK86_19470 [Planctomycetia bacterium]
MSPFAIPHPHAKTQNRKENYESNTVTVLIFSTRTEGVERPVAMHLMLLALRLSVFA